MSGQQSSQSGGRAGSTRLAGRLNRGQIKNAFSSRKRPSGRRRGGSHAVVSGVSAARAAAASAFAFAAAVAASSSAFFLAAAAAAAASAAAASALAFAAAAAAAAAFSASAAAAFSAAIAASEFAADAGAFDRDMVWRNQIPDDAQISFDPDHLHRILVNLIRNGLHAMEKARTPVMTVSAERKDDDWLVKLADEAGGVPEKARKTLFKPFGASGANGGAGLGLSITRELARANGGDVRLVSTGPEGSVFALSAPAAPA